MFTNSFATNLAKSELKIFEKILSQLGIEQFLKFQVIRDQRLENTITMVRIGVFGALI